MFGDQPRRRLTVTPSGFRNILGIGVMHMRPSLIERIKPAVSVARQA